VFCLKKFWLGILISLAAAGIFLSPGYAANQSNETVVNQHTTMVMDNSMEMSSGHASDTSIAEGNTMSSEDIHKNHDSENADDKPAVHQHTTMVMDDGMDMSHEHASEASTVEESTMSEEDVHKSHGSENAGEEPNHHKHDDRTTGKAGVGPNWPFIYTFLLFNTIVVITAGIMKFRNKEVLGNGRKI